MNGLSQGDIRGDGQGLASLQNNGLRKLQESRGNTGAAAEQGKQDVKLSDKQREKLRGPGTGSMSCNTWQPMKCAC